MSHVALSKGYVGGLYADITAAPYRSLFNPATSSKRVWSLVQLARRIDKTVKTLVDQTSPIQRGIVVHGNRFTMHCIMRRIGKANDLSQSEEIGDKEIENATTHVLSSVNKIIEKSYSDAYLAPLFKNIRKCSDIRSKCES
jgi:hypothetical protein